MTTWEAKTFFLLPNIPQWKCIVFTITFYQKYHQGFAPTCNGNLTIVLFQNVTVNVMVKAQNQSVPQTSLKSSFYKRPWIQNRCFSVTSQRSLHINTKVHPSRRSRNLAALITQSNRVKIASTVGFFLPSLSWSAAMVTRWCQMTCAPT